MKKVIACLMCLLMVFQVPIFVPKVAATSPVCLSINSDYSYSFPKTSNITGDLSMTNLNNGVVETTTPGTSGWTNIKVSNESQTKTDWNGTQRTVNLYDWVTPSYYIKMDMGFLQQIDHIILDFGYISDTYALPTNVEVFLSDDGYNFETYKSQTLTKTSNGNHTEYKISFESTVNACAIKAVVYSPINSNNTIDELSINGYSLNSRSLLSSGAAYTWVGTSLGGVYDGLGGYQMTDGIRTDFPSNLNTFFDRKFVMKKTGTNVDSKTGYKAQTICVDLGSDKNISQIKIDTLFNANGSYNATLVDFVIFRYSTDGVNYNDFGVSYVANKFGISENCYKAIFNVSKSFTVSARYVSIVAVTWGNLAVDEINVMGSLTAVAENNDSYFNRDKFSSYTNVLQNKFVKYNNVAVPTLTDEIFTNQAETYSDKTTVLSGDFKYLYNDICGFNIYFINKPKNIRLYLSEDNVSFTLVSENTEFYDLAGYSSGKAFFNGKKGRYFRIEMDKPSASTNISVTEIMIFGGQPHLPLIRGGFYQIDPNPIGVGPNIDKNTMYDWKMQFKGLKELGLDTIVVQFNADYTTKKTLMPITVGSALYNAGYRQRTGLMDADVLETILSLADGMNLKVYIGTIIGTSYSNIVGDKNTYYQNLGNDGAMVISEMQSRYNSHSSFAGYYLSDETCDMWLASNNNQGVTDFRLLYKIQSDKVRELSATKKVMISPAIWRYGEAINNANNLYNLVKTTNTMTKPVVDIIAAQDCLGRENTLVVSDATYNSFEENIEQWAIKARQAGCEFWSDAEIFDIAYMPKRYNDVINSLELESKITNGIIVFDLPNFTPFNKGSIDNMSYFESDFNRTQYSKRYYTKYKDFDKVGNVTGFIAPEVVPSTPRYDTTDLVKADLQPRLDGIISNDQWNKFTPFYIMGANDNTSSGMMWDNTYLYIGIKTNDKTATVQNDGSWFGYAADYFTLMMSNQSADLTGNAGSAPGSALIGITKQTSGISIQSTVGAGLTMPTAQDILSEFDDTNSNGRTAIIAVRWSWLGITPSVNMSLPIRILYKQDSGSTQSTDLYAGPEFSTFKLYSMKDNSLSVPKFNSTSFLRTDIQPYLDGRIQSNQWNEFTIFSRKATNENTSSALMWDNTYLYIGIKTNDKTATVQNDGGWFGNAADYFTLMMSNQNTDLTGNAGTAAGSIKIGITKQTSGISIQPTIGAGLTMPTAQDVLSAFDDTNPNGRTAIIAVRWSWLGITPSVNMSLPIRILYKQDGGSTQSTDLYAGPEIVGFKQYPLTDGIFDVSKYNTTNFIKTTESPVLDGRILTNEWNLFTSFSRQGAGENTRFALMWDNTYLYIALKTNDKTPTVQNDGGWFGNAADYFTFMMSNQNVDLTGNAGTAAGSVKIGITKQTSSISIQPTVGAGLTMPTAQDVLCEFDDTNPDGRTAILAIRWSWLGVTPSANLSLPIRILYKQDSGSTQSTDLYAGPEIGGFKQYVLTNG